MTGQEIVEAMTHGKHVNIPDSTGRWLHATDVQDGGEGHYTLLGRNQYNDERVRGIAGEDEYPDAYIPECPVEMCYTTIRPFSFRSMAQVEEQ